MKRIFTFLFILIISFQLIAQNTTIKGVITDYETGELLIGANVLAKSGLGTVTDLDGKYSFSISNGKYNLQISYVGFKTQNKTISATGKTLYLDFRLQTQVIDEVQIVADVAIARQTPIAFTNILPAKIEEELASQDIPMILNSTPGVYATQQGGGDGDARITIRGFDQRNIAVMLDGIPVNDMENGWVYWSNWFGLDAVTRSIQIQRGLSASKLALPSVGGTLNILSKGYEAKQNFNFKQEIGSNSFTRTSIGYSSGKLKNDWSISLAGSYKKGDGHFQQAWTEGWFYFVRLDKKIKDHLITFSVLGAPQKHGQRSYTNPIATWNKAYADNLIGDDTLYTEPPAVNLGREYNEHWGYLERWSLDEYGDTIHAKVNKVNTKTNYYHKPQISLKHFWTINEKLHLSNIVYASLGTGGGTGLKNSLSMTDDYQVDLQTAYNNQVIESPFTGLQQTTTHLYSSINNHNWYGLLSTLNYRLNDYFDFSGGLDLRSYKGEHYRELYDMLGGLFYYDEYKGISINNNNTANTERKLGDKIYYHNDGLVRWSGIFAQGEYSKDNLSGFINFSTSMSGYKRVDYFAPKDLVLPDTTMFRALGYVKTGNHQYVEDTVIYNGTAYTVNSPESRTAQTDWKWIPGFTIKTGANYNLTEHMNIFFNTGFLSKAARFNNVIGQDNQILKRIENEKVTAFELGHSYKSRIFSTNLNLYYTNWKNKPAQPFKVEGNNQDDSFTGYINGISALHKGVEFDFVYKILPQLNLEGLISLGDWKWNSNALVYVFNDAGSMVDTFTFDAKGVHVSDAAQTQIGASLRYQPIKGFYIKGKYTWFDRYFAYFNPDDLRTLEKPIDSWETPDYGVFDIHIGYKKRMDGYIVSWGFNVLNVLDELYISDAINNDTYHPVPSKTFDAKGATVFMGLGRRFTTSIKISM